MIVSHSTDFRDYIFNIENIIDFGEILWFIKYFNIFVACGIKSVKSDLDYFG